MMWVDPVCIICFKVIRNSVDLSANSSTKHESLLRKFALLSEKVVGLSETISSSFCSFSSRTKSGDILCSNCETVISGTCKLYQDLCAVQLKLGWRLKQLQASIRCHNQLSPKLKTVLQKRVASQLDLPGGLEQVQSFHRQLSSCCQVPGNQKEILIPLERYPGLKNHNRATAKGNKPIFFKTSVPDENIGTEVVKVENPNDEEEHDADDYFSSFDINQEEGPSPIIQEQHEPNCDTSVEGIDTSVGASKLRARKGTKYYTRRKTSKRVKIETPKEKKASLRFPNDGRDRSELTCRVCKRYVSNCLKRLRTHLGAEHEIKWKKRNKSKRPPHQCYFCYWSFAYEHSLQVHLELSPHSQVPSKGKFICSESNCDNLEFRNFSDFNSHFEEDHHGPVIFRCSLCSWPFLNDDMREVHELVHMKVKCRDTYDCPKCPEKKYTCVIALQNHYTEQHTSISIPDLRVYACPLCSTKCRYQDTFQDHLKAHEIESQRQKGIPMAGEYLTCDYQDCGRSFPSRKLLHSHRKIHKMTQCSKCGKFMMTAVVAQHMKILHKEGKPIPCPICGKNFLCRQRLKRHTQQVHDPEHPRTIKCHICQKEYQRGALLNKHLRDVHHMEVEALNVPPKYMCTECGKGYRDKGSLEQHVDAKHTEESQRRWNYKCQICMKSFWRPCLLNKHMSEVHPSDA